MAAKFPSASEVQLKPRKGHDMAWSCDEHGEPIKFYCKEHNVPLCHPCATKDHQKPCRLDNIGDVILEMGSKLEDKLRELDEMMQRSKKLNSEIQSCSTFMCNHLEAVNFEVNVAYEEKIKGVKDEEQEEILLINEEADDQIKTINETRDRRVKSAREKAEKKQRSLRDTKTQLLADSKIIISTVWKKVKELKRKNQHTIDMMDNISLKLKRINQDDKALVKESPRVFASTDHGGVSENVHQDIMDSLVHLQHEVQRVKFAEGRVGEDDYSRIDGYIGRWELAKSIAIPPEINSPSVPGLISNDELCVSLVSDPTNKALYISNIRTGNIRKVIKGDDKMCITSCAPVDSNLIVCGKLMRYSTGENIVGCITLYDRRWKVVGDITIPRNKPTTTSGHTSLVSVDVDKEGMILAGEWYQPNIYVINPADSKIVHTITMQGKKIWGRMQALSSGDIIVKTEKIEFTVISRSGEEKAVIHCNEWNTTASCSVDKLKDTLYITYWDKKNQIQAVDQVSCDGNIQARRIVEYKLSDLCLSCISCIISPSGDLITFTGATILVYKKIFVL